MKKGRIVLVFWLLAMLAVVTSMASYAWVAMNTTALMRGFEVELESDSLYLEISADRYEDYSGEVAFNRTVFYSVPDDTHAVDLITYGQVSLSGAIIVYPAKVTMENAYNYGTSYGTYNGGARRFYVRSESIIGGGDENLTDITDTLEIGDSILGYYIVNEGGEAYPTARIEDKNYHAKVVREDGGIDYVCIGKFAKDERIAGRKYWGYARSTIEEDSQRANIINVVSMDYPTDDYALKKTVFLRGARGSGDLQDLSVSSVEVKGRADYLTNSIRVMFVATSGDGKVVTRVYSNREPASFNGKLFEEVLGNEQEIITVDIYIYFDGKDDDAHSTVGILNSHTVNVEFSIVDHVYN